ncbi:hypothetical protein QLQ12_37830 [Actinoplanes sp. NEAU-A12]|uniref:ATP/GTP-binding protein n=2 Tax=Actinoplanes sandaracinus TaxID=3045177 RepID=A0ABT6WXA3_9ACTN|nr:hypothetical protein [Actinoplanes sandaracinus]MDI6104367.1 hypothetical protein [Actinoplanes sandaracinus]
MPAPVWAGDGTGKVECARSDPRPACNISAGTPQRPGKGSDGGGKGGRSGDGKCRGPQGQEIPCERDGGRVGAGGCYYRPANDLGPGIIEILGGQPVGEGGWYYRDCGDSEGYTGPFWIAGAPPVVSPEVVARQAVAKLQLPEVTIRMNPPGDQLVNLPIWLALDAASWTSQSATASVPGVSVTATARPVKVAWSMGDGTTRTCDGPGTAWTAGTDPRAASPDCGHVYRRASDAYRVTATVTWEVTWAGAGQSGTVPDLTTSGQVQTRVQESQAVISR